MVKSESQLLWKILLHILKIPIILLLIPFGKRKFSDLFVIFDEVKKFFFEAKFTANIIIITIITSFIGWIFLGNYFEVLINYPLDLLTPSRWFSFITVGFLHGSLLHLFGNMLALLIFGRVVEREIGSKKTAIVYFSALILSGIGNALLNLFVGNNLGGVGASGAIMGMVAAAMLLRPFYITYQLILPLPIMIVGWLTIVADITGILSQANDGIGHLAHLSGFLSIPIILIFLTKDVKSKMKKGFLINMVSLVIFGIVVYFTKLL